MTTFNSALGKALADTCVQHPKCRVSPAWSVDFLRALEASGFKIIAREPTGPMGFQLWANTSGPDYEAADAFKKGWDAAPSVIDLLDQGAAMNTNDADVLARCPFCGGEAIYEEVAGARPETSAWSIGCGDPDCLGFQSMAQFPRKCEAAKAWNTRALSRPVPEGFVLVPKEATSAQLKAGDDWLPGDLPGDWRATTLATIYGAMIAAAPPRLGADREGGR